MIVFGHRGARGEAPENTLSGFGFALGLGVDGLELDVRLSADGQLVVIHDETVDRTTDAAGPVAAFRADQLARLDARGSCPEWPQRVGVPTLEQVLRQTPFVLVRQNSRGEVELSVRGSDSRQAALLLDGLPLTLGWDHRTDASLIPTTGVRRVTLVRGLSSVLTGPNALGGVIAVDLNTPTNQRGTAGTMDPQVVQIFKKWGFAWGGDWSYTDPMHFEIGALLTTPRR